MQADEAMAGEGAAPAAWAARPLILAAIGLAAGLCVHFILGNAYRITLSTLEAASLTGVTLAAGLTGFTLERRLWWTSILFSLALALVGALVVAWNGTPEDWSVGEGWRMVSLLLAVAIAAPLFQAARDEGARRFPYPAVHDHAWTNVVLFGACCVFVAIVFALAWLLAMLFDLIKIAFLKELLQKDWFWRSLIGLAFGSALGLLREHDGVVRLLQRVVALVLAVLAPVLAVGLVLFVLALPFTGLDALWEATSATTPILLFCVVGALILANAVIGNAPDQERRFPLLRYGAMGLGVVMLPLAILATIAISLRTGQYGFTPERLWAIVFVGIACLWGAAYLVALALGRLDWAARVRPLNLVLAFIVCGVALVLATPLVSFNAISTRDQVARLESGKVTPEQFDWAALAFDFGKPGRAALERLRKSPDAGLRAKAEEAAKAETRWDLVKKASEHNDTKVLQERRLELMGRVRVLPMGAAIPEQLRNLIADDNICPPALTCSLFFISDAEALMFQNECFDPPNPKVVSLANWGCADPDRFAVKDGKWNKVQLGPNSIPDAARSASLKAGLKAGAVEVRTVPRRQTYIGGVPVGEPFE